LYKEWPGPAVNISWFVAKAYLANLYYTAQRDVGLIIKTCDDEFIDISILKLIPISIFNFILIK